MGWDNYTTTELLVQDYKNNKPGAAEDLLASFDKFLSKFSHIIVNSAIDLSNRCTRGFIGLFMANKDMMKNMHQVSRSKAGMECAGVAVTTLSSFFMSRYEKDEIENIIAMTLLECATRYKKLTEEKPMFHTYLLKCYHYKLYHNLMGSLDDSLSLAMSEKYYNPIHNNHADTSVDDEYNLVQYNPVLDKLYTEDDIEVDDNWIMGITANLFSDYSPLSRKILKLKFVDNYTDEEVAEVLAVSRKTVNEKKIALIKTIERDVRNLGLLKG